MNERVLWRSVKTLREALKRQTVGGNGEAKPLNCDKSPEAS